MPRRRDEHDSGRTRAPSERRGHSSDQALAERKTRERALVLPLVGLILLLPPAAGIFELDLRIAGVPFTALYLFVVWGALIAGAAALAGSLREDDRRDGEGKPPADGGETGD